MALSDDELVDIARRHARTMGFTADLVASVTARDPAVQVLLADPAYARGGGLLVIIDPASGSVLRAVRQL
jgi:hypothetical protein